ncbi:hypothetical protein LXM50_05365 [Microbacterium sp. Au-Mic1]|uniref:hypothetical protein n=1 Tax=Microbacterium sp. Au-Mic1 TaxID=2906457 RepID=UPI001E2A4CF8|nr:hypothetical protein [Microbacterium sp. Au-Mic1]MCE4025396.1 hypothetical protein [Microbacterium sp. Au-Mic1]
MYYYVDAEVPGSLGPDTVRDTARRAADAGPAHLVFDGWMGDDIVTTVPFWFVTERLADALRESGATGFELDPARVSEGPQYELAARHRLPSSWLRLIPTGSVTAGDDVALEDGTELVVSDAVLRVLRSFTLEYADVEPRDEDEQDPEADFFAQQAEKARGLADELRSELDARIEADRSDDSAESLPAVGGSHDEPGAVVETLFAALGGGPEAPEVVAAQSLFGDLGESRLAPKGGALKKAWLTLEYWHAGAMMSFGDDELCKIVVRLQPETGWAPYPHPERLVPGLTASSTRDQARGVLGVPEKESRDGDLWRLGAERYLHAWYAPAGGIGRITVMLRADGQ